MSVNEERDFGVEFTKRRESGKRDGNEIANATDVEDDLIGAFFEEAAAEESDHRMKVLPGERSGVNARRKRAKMLSPISWCKPSIEFPRNSKL